jgi:hypothetical protein
MATVAKSVEALIQEMEQQRANKQWERIKQVESSLKQNRPPLISRPKEIPHIQLPAGWQAPPPTVFELPPNPSDVHPSDPGQIKIAQISTGSGLLGWSAEGEDPQKADVWFHFTPHQDASYSFTAWFAFHGFYMLYADDGSLTSYSAKTELTVSLQAFQFDERPVKTFDVISIDSQNIDVPFTNYDQVLGIFTDTQDFREGQPVLVNAHIEVTAFAHGDGSYAELNFRDGEANFIQPLSLFVYPSP